MMHVRLKPHDGKKHLRRSYTVFGIKFVADRGWYKVDDDVAAYLKTVRQRSEDPDSHPAFDVCTEAEAKAIDLAEKQKAFRRAAEEAEPAVAPLRVHNVRRPEAAASAKRAVETVREESNDLTTADLQHRRAAEDAIDTDPGPVDAAPDLSGEFDDDMAAPPTDVPAAPPASKAPPPTKKGPTRKAPPLE